MLKSLIRLYQAGKIDEQCLSVAVGNGWITEEDKAVVLASA